MESGALTALGTCRLKSQGISASLLATGQPEGQYVDVSSAAAAKRSQRPAVEQSASGIAARPQRLDRESLLGPVGMHTQ